MVKADATPKKTWMDFVKEVRDNNPGMALKDILRLASKLRGKSSSGKSSSGKTSSGKSSSGKSSSGKSSSGKNHKKRGGMLLPILGGGEGEEGVVEPTAEEGQSGSGRKSKKSKKSQKKSRKSKSKKSSKRRH
jgi:hypothetical protein